MARRRGEVAVHGHAVEARVYAEDPSRDYRPSTGTLTSVRFPVAEAVRVDTWVEDGTEVSASYDPLLAKVIAVGADRDEAFDRLERALDDTVLHGIEVNVGTLRAALVEPDVRAARHSTVDTRRSRRSAATDHRRACGSAHDGPGSAGPGRTVGRRRPAERSDGRPVVSAGQPRTRQSRRGTWARVHRHRARATRDARHHRLRRRCRMSCHRRRIARADVGTDRAFPAGGLLDVGTADTAGLRTYVLVAGGFDVPQYLGSASTFTLGRFGGHGGRALVAGDVLRAASMATTGERGAGARRLRPAMPSEWELAVTEGPHGAPEFFTRADVEHVVRSSLPRALQLGAHRGAARGTTAAVGPSRRRGGGAASVEHPRHRVLRWRA